MFIGTRGFLLMLPLLCALQASAQQNLSTHKAGSIHLDVVVTANSGPPVSDLREQDFTVLDNGTAQKITSFLADGPRAPTEVVIVLDAVNVGSRAAVIELQEIEKFLKADGGQLAHPTNVAILTDKGMAFLDDFSSDGNAVSAALRKKPIAQRSLGRNTDHLAAELFRMSFAGLTQLIANERDRPGRKVVVWVSPGWPMLAGMKESKQKEVFGTVVQLTTQLREARITLYSIDPSGLADIAPGMTDSEPEHVHASVSDGVSVENARNPSDVGWGNLALQALATQTGGLALDGNKDIAAQLQKCVADAAAYYEISFVPAVSGPTGEYHRLEVSVGRAGLTARTRSGYYSQAPHASFFVADSDNPDEAENSDSSYANARPYLDWPMAELVQLIPELKNVQQASDQQQLPVILRNLGRSLDDFMRNIGDLIAHEDITQEKLDAKGRVHVKERVQDNYLILHHGYEWGARAEYRMDEQGNHLGPVGLSKGFLVTSGAALSCIRFATVAQPQSRFRYLGDEKIGERETYVLGFTQIPGQVTFTTVMRGTGGKEVDMLTQGILWVEKNNFQIIRMRSDLLAPNADLRLDQLTNEVNFGEVQLQEAASPLWLPSDASVSIEINHNKYRNIHRYSDYRRYRVSARLVAPE